MKLKLEMDVDNDAFLYTGELQTVLAKVARAVEDSEEMAHPRTRIRDRNGNTVGWYEVK